MNTIRLARSPWALFACWRDRRRIEARIRWTEGDIEFLQHQQRKDAERLEFLRGHLQELRVQLALIKP